MSLRWTLGPCHATPTKCSAARQTQPSICPLGRCSRRSSPILHNTFYLIVSPEHPLTGRSTLALADLAGQQLFYEPLYQEMVDLAVVQPGLPFSAPSWHMVENYECVYNDLLAGRGMFLCPMKYPAFPAAWYLPLQLPLPDTCLLTLRDDPRPEIQRLREGFTAVYASRAKLLGEA